MSRPTSQRARPDDFFAIAAEFPQRALLALLGIDRATLRRWREGRVRIPWCAYQLVRERSSYGLAERDAAEHFNRRMILARCEALERRVRTLEAELLRQARMVNWGAANDPFAWAHADPRSVLEN